MIATLLPHVFPALARLCAMLYPWRAVGLMVLGGGLSVPLAWLTALALGITLFQGYLTLWLVGMALFGGWMAGRQTRKLLRAYLGTPQRPRARKKLRNRK